MHNHEFLPHFAIVRNVNIASGFVDMSYAYRFKTNDDLSYQLSNNFRNGFSL